MIPNSRLSRFTKSVDQLTSPHHLPISANLLEGAAKEGWGEDFTYVEDLLK